MTVGKHPRSQEYSVWSLICNGIRGKHWPQNWRAPEPKPRYDVVIIGAGGHGLATAYYLAKNHGITNIAVLERGWLGGGNTGRNTTVVRSNYLYPESARFFDFSLKLYEQLSTELNYNIMLSQRGMLTLAHTRHDLDFYARWVNAMQLNSIDAEMLRPEQLRDLAPALNFSPTARYPIKGGFIQHRAGVARHDAVAWGYARAADAMGVDIIQQCEVVGISTDHAECVTLDTTRGRICADKVGIAVAGHASVVATMAGLQIPIESFALQAFVSEPVKPILDTIIQSPTVHVYASQSDKGELVVGGGTDPYLSYAQRGSFAVTQHTVQSLVELFPSFSRLRLLRQWAGVVDLSPDRSPIIDKTAAKGIYISCGWGTGGFKAIPAGGLTFAYLIANDSAHPLIEPFGLARFRTGRLIDEGAASGVVH